MNSERVLFIILMAIGKVGYGYLMLLHAICATASYCRAVCRLLLATARYCCYCALLRKNLSIVGHDDEYPNHKIFSII